MPTSNYFSLVENTAYHEKSEACNVINTLYSHMSGVTTYYESGKWFIVQMNGFKHY